MSPKRGILQFIGVTTGSSAIHPVFSAWVDLLGIEATLEGVDLPLHAPREHYRAALQRIRDDSGVAGALVTSHKLDLVAAAADLFDRLDPLARQSGEVSCISKGPAGELIGHAKDPITAGLALADFVPADHWRGGAEVLCLGSGGAALAIALHLAGSSPGPSRMRVSDVRADRLDHLRAVLGRLGGDLALDTRLCRGSGDNDRLLAELPPDSLVINATGLGKDRPGSPLGPDARFPARALVWELNYRGRLDLLRQARDQQRERALLIEDGWRYFLHGWSQVIAEVYALPLSPELFGRLAAAAAAVRPPR